MPELCACTDCGLRFAVGWEQIPNPDQPGAAWAQTLMVCLQCGTQHAVEHAPEVSSLADVLRACDTPYFLTADATEARAAARNWTRSLPTGGFRSFALSCLFCHEPGTLRDEWPAEGAPCPSCGRHLTARRRV